jgi:macrolide-specific efflux system membrane fusion protein
VEAGEHDEKAQQALLRTAHVALDSARDRLKYTEVRAPMAGTVIERGIQPGEVVTPGVQATFEGKPLLVIANLEVLLVRAELNQIDVAKLVLGQKVKLTLDAVPGREWEAVVTKIAPASVTVKEREAEVFPVEATLAVADPAVKPGMTADLRILVEEKGDVLTLPIEAVRKEDQKRMVTKLTTTPEGPHKEPVEVQVGKSNDREIEITGGLAEGDRVVIDPGSSKDNEAKM